MLIPQSPDDPSLIALMEELENETRKVGLYMMGWMQGQMGDDVEFVMTTFLVGAEAFDDRVLNPERYAEDGTFRELVDEIDPDEQFLEDMKQRKAQGKSILDD